MTFSSGALLSAASLPPQASLAAAPAVASFQASREPSVQILERPGDSSPRPVHRIPKPAHLGAQIEFHLQQSLRQARAPSTTLSQVIDPCKEPRVEAF